jgi:hypothetical protein
MSNPRRHCGPSTSLVRAVVLALVASSAPSAALAAPPSKKTCTQTDPFERLACRQGAIADQMAYTSETAFKDGTKLQQNAGLGHLAHIRNAKEKAQRAARQNTKDVFKRQSKGETNGTRQGGHLVPLDADRDDADHDGVCDYEQGNSRAKCAAIDVDANGNLQECNPAKKNKGKGKEGLECDVRIDLDEAATPSEAEAAAQLDDTYSATEDNLIEMNEDLDAVNASSTADVRVSSSACDVPTVDPALATAVRSLRIVQGTIFGAARISADFGGQTFVVFGFGGNTRTLAVVFDSLALAANIAYLVTDEILKAESGKVQGAIMACVGQSASDIAAMQTQILNLQTLLQKEHAAIMANDNANRATITNRVEEVRWEVVDLLNTPPGRRPDFPSK